MVLFLVGLIAGLAFGLAWHWWVFARYDAWIVDNGGRLPSTEDR